MTTCCLCISAVRSFFSALKSGGWVRLPLQSSIFSWVVFHRSFFSRRPDDDVRARCDIPQTPYAARGFTLIELMIVVFFLSALSTLSIPTFAGFSRRQTVKLAVDQLRGDVRNVQISSLSGKKEPGTTGALGVWGIRFTPNSRTYTLFSCPANADTVNDYSFTTCTGNRTTKTLPGKMEVKELLGQPTTGGMSLIYTAYEDSRVLFHTDDGDTITDPLYGDPLRETFICVGEAGSAHPDERWELYVPQHGAVDAFLTNVKGAGFCPGSYH